MERMTWRDVALMRKPLQVHQPYREWHVDVAALIRAMM
jgi:hypothetical protein